MKKEKFECWKCQICNEYDKIFNKMLKKIRKLDVELDTKQKELHKWRKGIVWVNKKDYEDYY